MLAGSEVPYQAPKMAIIAYLSWAYVARHGIGSALPFAFRAREQLDAVPAEPLSERLRRAAHGDLEAAHVQARDAGSTFDGCSQGPRLVGNQCARSRGSETMTDSVDPRTPRPLSGQVLAAFRHAVGLSQTALAQAAGLSRHTVRRWEQKAVVDVEQSTFERLIGVLMPPTQTRFRRHNERTREDRVIYHLQQRVLGACWLAQEQAERASNGSVLCGARTRKGQPCRNMSEPGRRRCKFHGGRSTGPRTPEGRARIAEAQRQRWEASRQAVETRQPA